MEFKDHMLRSAGIDPRTTTLELGDEILVLRNVDDRDSIRQGQAVLINLKVHVILDHAITKNPYSRVPDCAF